ncbi:MAG TPA: winged helix-turn-helix transcriptional regulator [Acidimicrobiales bacterium]|jgi:DNA-binding HxlR family transcriptional regulator|nr:winged helix-turn-helix transcriptional regulator [Acidimicrobiales bacterium]
MGKRSYSQYCAVARGLDVIGDRWMLLIVRDLLLGPKRYKDLLTGLPGIGTNLLAARLQEMEKGALIERTTLPPPAGSSVYRLTVAGQALEPVIMALGRWGARFLGPVRDDDILVPRAYFVAIRSSFRPERAVGVSEVYEIRVAGLAFEVRVHDGCSTTREGAAVNPDAVMEMDSASLNALLLEGLSAERALREGLVEVSGDPSCLARFLEMFAIRSGNQGRPGVISGGAAGDQSGEAPEQLFAMGP